MFVERQRTILEDRYHHTVVWQRYYIPGITTKVSTREREGDQRRMRDMQRDAPDVSGRLASFGVEDQGSRVLP